MHAFARLTALAVIAIAASTVATACTFLVQFHDEPIEVEGGPQVDDASGGGQDAIVVYDATFDAGHEAGQDAHVSPDANVVDAGADHVSPCAHSGNGLFCGNDGLDNFTGSPSDLVACEDGAVDFITACDGGCSAMPAPFPDTCNPCLGQSDGLYCGSQLPGFPAQNADILVECQDAAVAGATACGGQGCTSSTTPPSCELEAAVP